MRRMYSEKQIDSQIKEIIEGGQVDNAKPLYFHPITILHGVGASATMCASIIIINNNSNAIDTYAKLKTALVSIYSSLPAGSVARFPCSGWANDTSKWVINSLIEVDGTAEGNIKFTGRLSSTNANGSLTFAEVNTAIGELRVFDGVNKIN